MPRILAAALPAVFLLGCAQSHLNASGAEYIDVPPILSIPDAAVGPDPEADLLFSLLAGELAAQAGDYAQASRYYLEAARRSADVRVAERATRLALFSRDHSRALLAAERWLVLDPSNLEAVQVAAVLRVNEGKGKEAFELLRRIVDQLGNEEGFRVAASLLVQAENRDTALLAMEQLVAANAGQPAAWQSHAELALRFEDFRRARDISEEGIARFPDAVRLRILLARALTELDDPDAAIVALAAAVDAHPDRRDVRLAYARALVDAKDFERVRPEFDRLIALAPDDGDLLLTTALLSLEAGRFGLAEDYLRQLLARGMRAHDANYYLGRLHEQAGDLDAARRSYRSVEEGEHSDDAKLRLARLTVELDGLPAGRELYVRLQEDPDEAVALRAYLAEANLLRERKQLDQALERLARGLIQFPRSEQLLYLRGLVHERAGDVAAAEADFRAILERDPDNVSALNALGYTLADRTDRYEEAYDLITRAYEQSPDDAAIVDSYGWVLYRLGRLDEAIVQLERAHSLMQDGEIASNLAVVLWELGRREESRAIIEDALQQDPEHERLLRVKRELGF